MCCKQTSAVSAKRIPKFSYFFNRIQIEISAADASGVVSEEWIRDRAATPVDGITLTRTALTDFTARITLHVDSQPTRLKLSQPLSKLLKMDTETRPRVITNLWQYVKVHSLQDQSDPAYIICDQAMTEVRVIVVVFFNDIFTCARCLGWIECI